MRVDEREPVLRIHIRFKNWIIAKGFWLAMCISIVWLMYFECLHDKDCNYIATGFFALIGLGCFINLGIPIDRLVNKDIISNNP